MAVADAAIEAVVEKVEPKKEAFAVLDEVLPSDALLLTNTTSISITDLASATRRPDKVCGTHFFTRRPSGRQSRCHVGFSRATRP